MNKIKFLISTAILLMFSSSVLFSQQIKVFSLEQALQYAMENNYDLMKSEKDIEAAKQQVRESTAIGLPQINAAVKYNDNIQRPTMILPPEFSGSGEPAEIQFGTKYDASLSATATQLIFSGEYIVGLRAANKYLESTDAEFFRNKVAVKQQVANSYYNVLLVENALEIIDTTLKVTRNLADETRATFEVGFTEDTDVDQLELLVSDLEASRLNFQNQLVMANSYLKFYLGLSVQDSLVLTDNFEEMVSKQEKSDILGKTLDVQTNPDFYSLIKQKELSQLQVDLEKTAYLPSLSAFLNYQTQAQRDQWDFFNSKGKWYSSSIFGVQMDIPIFSSGQRNAKLKKAKIAYEQINIQEQQLKTTLDLQFNNARNEYLNSYKVYTNKKKNKQIAEKIYLKTTEKYKEGLAGSLDILNTHNQFLQSEQDFLNASQAFLNSAEELKKILTKNTN